MLAVCWQSSRAAATICRQASRHHSIAHLLVGPLAKACGAPAPALGLTPALPGRPALPAGPIAARCARVMCAAKDAALKAAGADEPATKPFSFPSLGKDPSQGSSEPSPAHPEPSTNTPWKAKTCNYYQHCD